MEERRNPMEVSWSSASSSNISKHIKIKKIKFLLRKRSLERGKSKDETSRIKFTNKVKF